MSVLKSQEKIGFNFLLSKDVDQKFRAYVGKKYGGYHRGALSKEVELAIVNWLQASEFVEEGDR